jgi:arsenate reductase
VALLEEKGISTEGYYSKSWNDLPLTPNIVTSVCGNAANETCPAYLGPVLRSHWGVEDPAYAEGTEEEIKAAFIVAYCILRHRIEQFLALPLNELKNDHERLKAELDRIGTLLP